MPLEGQWERQHAALWPSARRERRALAVVGGLLASVLAIVVVLASRAGDTAKAGCVQLTIASTTGGAAVHACGEKAARLCGGQTPVSPQLRTALRARCREAGLS
jgi:hypothetical protein